MAALLLRPSTIRRARRLLRMKGRPNTAVIARLIKDLPLKIERQYLIKEHEDYVKVEGDFGAASEVHVKNLKKEYHLTSDELMTSALNRLEALIANDEGFRAIMGPELEEE